jgi:hypothetical protein
VREQEQSFNVIDVGEGVATITVHAWKRGDFTPNDARSYRWQAGRWKLTETTEPAH